MEFPNSGGGKLVSGLKWAATSALAAAFLVQLKQCLDKYSSRQASCFLFKKSALFSRKMRKKQLYMMVLNAYQNGKLL